MIDTITLPRADFEAMREALEGLINTPNDDSPESVARAIIYNGKARRVIAAINAANAVVSQVHSQRKSND